MGKKDFKLKFTNDYFVRTILSKNNEEARNVLRTIIQATTGIHVTDVKVNNPIINRERLDDKEMVMDIHVKDELGVHYNIEMQTSRLFNEHIYRFFRYAVKTWAKEVKKGNNYKQAKGVYQIVFVNDTLNQDQLIYDYQMCHPNSNDLLMERGKGVSVIYVCMPNINKYLPNNLDSFGQIVYLFENNEVHDKMKLTREVSYIMKEYEKFTENEYEMDLALKRELMRIQEIEREARIKEERQEAKRQGRAEGLAEGLAEGRKEGRKEGRREGLVEGHKAGLEEGRLLNILENVQNMVQNLNLNEEECYKILNITLEERERLKKIK